MKILQSVFYFLGSVYLALILIGFLALYVIFGTYLESQNGSHLYAAAYSYQHPLFNLLLGFFFVNILVSALRRWPFKPRHVPFLITHLGLLMILSGVMIKNRFGVQGHLQIKEGQGSHIISLPETQVLAFVDQQGNQFQYPNEVPPQMKIKVLEYYPNVKEEWMTWVKNSFGYILGHPPFPTIEWKNGQSWPKPIAKLDSEWHLLALKTDDIHDALCCAWVDDTHKPLLLMIQHPDKSSTLWAFGNEGSLYEGAFCKDQLHSLLIYDSGFSGYAVQAFLPELSKTIFCCPIPFEILKSWCQENALDFPSTLVKFLKTQHLEGFCFDWKKLPKKDQLGCYWTSLLLQKLQTIDGNAELLCDYLKTHRWPFSISKTENIDELFLQIAPQLFSVADQLPETAVKFPSNPIEHSQWLSAFMCSYGISYQTLLPDTQPLPDESQINIETFIQPHYIAQESSKKWEENRPGIMLRLESEGKIDKITLAFQEPDSRLAFPVLGQYLVSFKNEEISIPYHLRLRQARQINYPHSNQTYSYECDVLIDDQEFTLSMNRVHETWEGYRFYLSGIASAKDEPIKQVQIVVNHDPAKYWLTYPGGLLVALGTFFLFWIIPFKR